MDIYLSPGHHRPRNDQETLRGFLSDRKAAILSTSSIPSPGVDWGADLTRAIVFS